MAMLCLLAMTTNTLFLFDELFFSLHAHSFNISLIPLQQVFLFALLDVNKKWLKKTYNSPNTTESHSSAACYICVQYTHVQMQQKQICGILYSHPGIH